MYQVCILWGGVDTKRECCVSGIRSNIAKHCGCPGIYMMEAMRLTTINPTQTGEEE